MPTCTGAPDRPPAPGGDRQSTPEEVAEVIRAEGTDVLVAPEYPDPELRPVCVALHAQEIGAMTAARCTPKEFMQFLLMQFKAAGAPVEGIFSLRLAHGKVYKMKAHPWGRAWVGYMWLPEELNRRLAGWRAENTGEARMPAAVGER